MPTRLADVEADALVAIRALIAREGGLVDNPRDRGGLTKYGITIPYYVRYRRDAVMREDIINLTEPQAVLIYYENTWVQARLSAIVGCPSIKEMMFDWCVTSGEAFAIRALQDYLGVFQDAKIGPVTSQALSDAVNRHGEATVRHDLVDLRFEKIIKFVQHHPDQVEFLLGWYRRVNVFRPYQ